MLPLIYAEQVAAAGGIPVLLPPVPGVSGALPRLDALVLSGGGDIDPASYGADHHPRTHRVYPDRDRAELALLRAALSSGLPVLGICRGLQIINVYRAGTLRQHLPDLVGHDGHGSVAGQHGAHGVRIDCASNLAGILGPPPADGELWLTVPTSHHQAIDRLGPGLVATAWAEDGTIEAVEPDPAGPAWLRPGQFFLGVQWHPEVGDDPRLFQALTDVAQEPNGTRQAGAGGTAQGKPLDSRA